MAFRAEKATAYDRIRSQLTSFKQSVSNTRAQMAAGSVGAGMIRALLSNCIAIKAAMTAAAAVPGIADYAQAQEGDPAYDVAAEFAALGTAIDAVGANILASIPTSGGFVLTEQWAASGFTERQFTSAQTATLRGLLDTVIAAID